MRKLIAWKLQSLWQFNPKQKKTIWNFRSIHIRILKTLFLVKEYGQKKVSFKPYVTDYQGRWTWETHVCHYMCHDVKSAHTHGHMSPDLLQVKKSYISRACLRWQPSSSMSSYQNWHYFFQRLMKHSKSNNLDLFLWLIIGSSSRSLWNIWKH